MKTLKSAAPRGAADRLAYLFKLVAGGPPQFTLGELAERADLPASSVHRLLQALVRSGLVERGQGQSYRPGRELHRLASQLVAGWRASRLYARDRRHDQRTAAIGTRGAA